MGRSRRPCRQGGRAASTAASDPLNHVLGGLQPFPPLHAARWTSTRRRQRPSPCWTRSASCAATARRGRPGSCGRIRSGGGCCARNPITVSGRRRCCSTCGTRSAPTTFCSRTEGRVRCPNLCRELGIRPVTPRSRRRAAQPLATVRKPHTPDRRRRVQGCTEEERGFGAAALVGGATLAAAAFAQACPDSASTPSRRRHSSHRLP